MNVNKKPETSAKAWFLRALLGPAIVVDGLICSITIGTISFTLTLRCARALARARMENLRA